MHITARASGFQEGVSEAVAIAEESLPNWDLSLIEALQISGVVILGDAGALGVFTQAEALLCRNLPMNTPVADAMNATPIKAAKGQ